MRLAQEVGDDGKDDEEDDVVRSLHGLALGSRKTGAAYQAGQRRRVILRPVDEISGLC